MKDVVNSKPQSPNLAELRSKTDRQLVALVGRRLDMALAQTTRTDRAEIYAEARKLMPLIRGVSQTERLRLESRLARLGELLGGTSARACTACF